MILCREDSFIDFVERNISGTFKVLLLDDVRINIGACFGLGPFA